MHTIVFKISTEMSDRFIREQWHIPEAYCELNSVPSNLLLDLETQSVTLFRNTDFVDASNYDESYWISMTLHSFSDCCSSKKRGHREGI